MSEQLKSLILEKLQPTGASYIEGGEFIDNECVLDFNELSNVTVLSFNNVVFENLTSLGYKLKVWTDIIPNLSVEFIKCTFKKNISFGFNANFLNFSECVFESGFKITGNFTYVFILLNHDCCPKLILDCSSQRIDINNSKFESITYPTLNNITVRNSKPCTLNINNTELGNCSVDEGAVKYVTVENCNASSFRTAVTDSIVAVNNLKSRSRYNKINITFAKSIYLTNIDIVDELTINGYLKEEEISIVNADFKKYCIITFNTFNFSKSTFRNINFDGSTKLWSNGSKLLGLSPYSVNWPDTIGDIYDELSSPEQIRATYENHRDLKTVYMSMNDIEHSIMFHKLEMKGRLLYMFAPPFKFKKFFDAIPLLMNKWFSDFHTSWPRVVIAWILFSILCVFILNLNGAEGVGCFNKLKYAIFSIPDRLKVFFDPFNSEDGYFWTNTIKRISGAYFSYQFLMAFRKYNRKF